MAAAPFAWTSERDAFLKAQAGRQKARLIAAELGVSAHALQYRAGQLGLSLEWRAAKAAGLAALPAARHVDCPQARALAHRALKWAREGDRTAAAEILNAGAQRAGRTCVGASLAHLADLIGAPESCAPDGALRDFGGAR